MERFDPIGFREPDDRLDADVLELVGHKLPRKLRRIITPDEFEYLRLCKPFGNRRVRDFATDYGIRLETLYRRLHRVRIELEFYVLEKHPLRIQFLLDHARGLRESGGRIDHAEQYLKRALAAVPKLKRMPATFQQWMLANACLELGHVYRDRGDENRRYHALATYHKARDAFLKLEAAFSRRWSQPDFSCGWIVAEQNALQMNKIFEYDEAAQMRLYESAVAGYQRVQDTLRDAPRNVPRYHERRAETLRLIGEHMVLAGAPQDGMRLLNEACRYTEGPLGDRISRRMHHAEAWLVMGKYDEALADLEQAQDDVSRLQIEKGIFTVRVGRLYCKLYRRIGDFASLQQTADRILRSAKKLGLKDQEARILRLLQNS